MAGILTTAIALGGIFAWFTATAGVNEGAVDTAQVGVGLESNGTAFLFEWAPYGVTLQRSFITEMDKALTLADKAASLGEFWKANDLVSLITPDDWNYPDRVNMYMPQTIVFDEIGDEQFKVTPGSILFYKIRYINTSNIPVYLRFKAPAISAWKEGLPPAELPTYSYGVVPVDFETYVDADLAYEDGYYYFTKPLGIKDEVLEDLGDDMGEAIVDIGDRDVEAALIVYVDHNMTGYQGGIIDVGGLEVEVIQATNNAAPLAWGTKNVTFEPYVAP